MEVFMLIQTTRGSQNSLENVLCQDFWSTEFPDLTPTDCLFFPWSLLKDNIVYANTPGTIDYLKENVGQNNTAIPAGMQLILASLEHHGQLSTGDGSTIFDILLKACSFPRSEEMYLQRMTTISAKVVDLWMRVWSR
jgi:hypothetical protein